MRGKSLNKIQTVDDLKGTTPEGYNLYNINSSFVSTISTFPWRETYIFDTPNQVTSREKYFNHNIYKGKMPTSAVSKHPSIQFFLHGPRLFHLSTEKVWIRSFGNGHQSGYSRADTINKNINKR